jgi:hypothetical protein
MEPREATGKRGEAIFVESMLNFCGNRMPYFDPVFLGEKNETIDYMIKLEGVKTRTLFFFVQVKTTRLGYTRDKTSPRLKVRVSRADIAKIKQYTAPVYLVGIDEPRSLAFIIAVNDKTVGQVSSLSTKYPLNCTNLRRLWDEVQEYWRPRDMTLKNSAFSE